MVERIVRAGHEVAHHGYCHEDPRPLERQDEERILERGSALIEQAAGERPRGYRYPSGSFSRSTVSLPVENGFLYQKMGAVMLERLIKYMKSFEGVQFARMANLATAWKRENPATRRASG